jgi:AraC-like DNA-binding protein
MTKEWTFLTKYVILAEKRGNMHRFSVKIDKIPRFNPFFLPVQHIGYLPEEINNNNKVRHPTINFSFILSSLMPQLSFIIDGKKYNEAAPVLIFEKPGIVYEYLQKQKCETFYFSYNAKYFEHFRTFTEEPLQPIMPLAFNSAANQLINKILELCMLLHNPGAIDRLDRLCEQLVNEAVLSKKISAGANNPWRKAVCEAASHIEIHFTNDIDLNVFARKYGLSKRTFLRYWDEIFKQPPKKYITDLRIKEAKRLLIETELRINEVATKIGISDPYYFSRMFKLHVGVSPASYRCRKESVYPGKTDH